MTEQRKVKVGFLAERMLLGFGVDLVVDQQAMELTNLGYDVTVFCLRTDGTYENRPYRVVQIAVPLYKNPLKTEKKIWQALRRLNHEDIDLWIAQTYPFFLAPLAMDRPVIVVDHGVSSPEGFSWMKRIVVKYMQWSQQYVYFRRAARVVNISEFTQALTPRYLRPNQEIIYNGADHYPLATEAAVVALKKKHGIADDELVLLYVGRINPHEQPYKGTQELVDLYVDLHKRHPRVRLLMAGFGGPSEEEWLRDNDVVPFMNVSAEDLSTLYAAADVYVSASKWEGFNLPAIEAQRNGVPVVLYNRGAHPEVIQEDAGLLLNNRHEFATAIETLIHDTEKRQAMSAAALRNSERFTWKQIGAQYQDLIERVLAEHPLKEYPYERGLVDVITLNYKGKQFLADLFASLKEQTYQNIRVTIVDNASNDGSVEYIRENFPWVNLIVSDKNLFFSRGNNLAVGQTNGEYLLLVNNDMTLEPDAVEKMVETVERQGVYTVGAVAAKMLFADKRQMFDSVGTVMTESGAPFNRGIGQLDIGQYDVEEEVFGACFGTVLIRRVVYEKIVEPLDNSYFGYFEDVDWSYRAILKGYNNYLNPEAVSYHLHSGTTKQNNYNWKYYYIHRNFVRTVIKDFELKRAILKGGRKYIELAVHGLRTKEPGRSFVVARILGNTALYLPMLLAKRMRIQSSRVRSDFEATKFSAGEISAFDPVAYEPILTLDVLSAMFGRLNHIQKEQNPEVKKIAHALKRLNDEKMTMNEQKWEEETTAVIASCERFIGAEYVKKFTDAVVKDKIWKQ